MDADNAHTCGILNIRPHTVCGVSMRQSTRAVCGRTLELPTRVGAAISCHTPNKYYLSSPRVCGTKQKCPHVLRSYVRYPRDDDLVAIRDGRCSYSGRQT